MSVPDRRAMLDWDAVDQETMCAGRRCAFQRLPAAAAGQR
jgi:hypothetical protein